MPRKARIDAPGALHHIMARGIERRSIFNDRADRDEFIRRLGTIIRETQTACYAWVLMRNHVHLLLRTGATPIATVMRRLLTGHAVYFNRRNNRQGQLFQNRYKSILCEQDPYLKELVRYIHLNPIRAGAVASLDGLKRYPYCGHGVLLGFVKASWQSTDDVLSFFGNTIESARQAIGEYMAEGMNQGHRPDLTGGGLIRSHGGWSAVKSLRRAETRVKADERILGGTDFVQQVLDLAQEQLEERNAMRAGGIDLTKLTTKVVEYFNVDPEDLQSNSKKRPVSKARTVLCYLAVRKLNYNCCEVAKSLSIKPSTVSRAISRWSSIQDRNMISSKVLELSNVNISRTSPNLVELHHE